MRAPGQPRPGTSHLLLLAALGLLQAGCEPREFLGSGRHDLELFLFVLAGFLIVAFWIGFSRRRGDLREWDLAINPSAPAWTGALRPLLWWGLALLLIFLVADLTLVDHTGQKVLNFLLWLGGTVMGAFLGGFLGVRLAERPWRG